MTNVSECGIRHLPPDVSPSIINGQVSPPGEWPWQVAVLHTAVTGGKTLCSATMISPEWLLTSAHCMQR